MLMQRQLSEVEEHFDDLQLRNELQLLLTSLRQHRGRLPDYRRH